MEIAKFRLFRANGVLIRQYSLGRLACLLILVPGSTFGATIYTAKTGSDGYTCTQVQSESTPKLTIAGGISCMSSGDTLIVKAGTYNESLNNLPSGSPGNYTTIKANPTDTVIISRSGGAAMRAFNGNGKSYIEFDGLIITGADLYNGIKIQGGSHHLRIQNCEIYGAETSGILDNTGNTGTFSGGNEILNNSIHNNGRLNSKLDHGLYLTSSDNIVWDNDFYNNSGYGVSNWTSGLYSQNNNYQYNRIYNNGTAGESGGITVKGFNHVVANNLVWDNAAGGIWTLGGNNNQFYYNTVYNNRGAGNGGGITTVGSSNTLVTNNIIYANSANINDLGSGTVFNSNLMTNPSFVNAAANDFRIQPGSPARDSGVALAGTIYDFDKVPRPQGGGVDIGAYEYTDSLPTTANKIPNPPSALSASAN